MIVPSQVYSPFLNRPVYGMYKKITTVVYFFKFYVYVPVMINVVIACILYEGLINQYVLYVVRVTYLYYLFMFAAWGKLNTTVSRKGTCTYRCSPNHRTCFFCIVVLTLLCGARDIDLNANNGLVLLTPHYNDIKYAYTNKTT